MSEAPPLFPSTGTAGSSSLRRTSRNPFAPRGADDRERKSFPSIDFCFENNNRTIDQSQCSQDGSSILNMSIGARAALNEHMRHVYKFGIDGEQLQRQDEEEQQQGEEHVTKNTLDEQWDYLLDDHHGSRVNTSGSFTAVSSSYPRLDILLQDASGIESIEVMTDVSHDYFNSSLIKKLATPERNQHRRDHVVTRDDSVEEQQFYEEDDFELEATSSSISCHNLDDNVTPELKAISQHSSDRNESSFQSFCAADLSRISNADSELRRSPNSSFQDHRFTIDDGAFSPILDVASPSRCPESSFLSTPRRSPPRHETTPKFPTVLGSSNSSSRRTSLRPRRTPRTAKENVQAGFQSSLNFMRCSPNRSPPISNTGSISHAAAAAAACSSLRQRAPHQLELGLSEFSALDTLPSEFLQAIEAVRSDAPSPISQAGSSHHARQEATSSSSRKSSSFEKSTSSGSSSIPSLTGRKRYRTVVPRRVYMDSPSQFPEEKDSFATPSLSSNDSSHDTAQRSLLDSFEVAYRPTF